MAVLGEKPMAIDRRAELAVDRLCRQGIEELLRLVRGLSRVRAETAISGATSAGSA
jgi:hypothetical protein